MAESISMVNPDEYGLASGQLPSTSSNSYQALAELVDEDDWSLADVCKKREALKLAAARQESSVTCESFKKEYQAAVKDCDYDRDEDNPTIIQYLTRVIEPYQFKNAKFYHALVEMSLMSLAARLGPGGLGDSLHYAIERKHFDLLKLICDRGTDPNLKDMVEEGIAFLKSNKQNCLHAVIATDPRNIAAVDTLVQHAGTKAFKTKRDSNGNTPLHDFVTFRSKRFMICRCGCHKCEKGFPHSVRDERLYTTEFVQTLRKMIEKYPEALSTPNNEGKTPYVVHIATRTEKVNENSWAHLEYGPTEHDGQTAETGTENQVQAPAAPIHDATSTQPRPFSRKKDTLKKASSTASGKPSPGSRDAHDDTAWSYSRHLARETAKELLEACSSQPSWDKAKESIFGNQRLDDQSTIQTSLRMEDALYKNIEEDHDFLKFNSILAYVELSLASPSPDSILDPDAFATADLAENEMINNPHPKMTPELARNRNAKYLHDVFEWLGKKGVKRILKLVIIDNQEWQCSDETIEECLKPWDIRYLDWNKQDLSIEAVRKGQAVKLVELWLNWSGQNTSLLGWSDPVYGLKSQLPHLKRVHIQVDSSVESVPKMTNYLAAFKKRIEQRTGELIVAEQQILERFDDIKFDLPQELRTRSNSSKKGWRGVSSDQENKYHHRWMVAIKKFAHEITESYSILKKDSDTRQLLDNNPIKVALIDDGVNPSKLHVKGSVKGGWPPDGVAGHRKISTYYNSTEGHGTTMANLIHNVCPFVHLYVAKLEKSPPKPYRSVLHMAAEAVKWAVSEKVDVISMSWTIKANAQMNEDKEALTKHIQDAERAGISLFCSSDDTGAHTPYDQLLPSSSMLLKRIGSCNGNGTKSDFVNERGLHYLFPGEQLLVMQKHLKSNSSEPGKDRGSSASTALAAGLASLILWCSVRSDGDKREFANERMYALFDKLKTDQNPDKASLVDVSGLMEQVMGQGEPATITVKRFIQRLREKIPGELRQYEDSNN